MKPSSGGDGPGTAAAGRLVAPDRQWQPDLYLRYAAYRERPAHDLLAQVPDLPDDLARGLVVDLGCGPGNVTPHLAARFPRARRSSKPMRNCALYLKYPSFQIDDPCQL